MKKILLLFLLPAYCFAQTGPTLITNVNISSEMLPVNGKLVFAGDTGASLTTIWITDGTAGGTHPLREEIKTDPDMRLGYQVYRPIVFNNEFYFIGDSALDFTTLGVWKTDGTTQGTVLVKVFGPTMLGPGNAQYPFFCISNNQLFFAASDGVHGTELWKTDGTTNGTVMVKDISPNNTYGSIPAFLFDYKNELYFSAYLPASGTEIWKSDGTENGTVIFKDEIPGSVGIFDLGYGGGSMDPQFTISGDYLFFTGRKDSANVGTHLYRTDGTPENTIPLDTSNTKYDNEDASGPFQTDVNGVLYYTGITDSTNPQYALFKSDGTPQGTVQIREDSSFTPSGNYFAFNNKAYFNVLRNNYTQSGVAASNGTSQGTAIVLDFNGGGSAQSNTSSGFLSIGNSFFTRVAALVGNSGDFRMVQTNGTQVGTIMYNGVSARSALTLYNGAIYFFGLDTVTYHIGSLYKIQPATTLPTGVENVVTVNNVTIYPNPVNETLTIHMEIDNRANATLSIYNLLGERVYTNPITTANTLLNVSPWPTGIYFCTVQQNDNTTTVKVIVQH